MVSGRRLQGRRGYKLGNVVFALMALVMLAVWITATMGGMAAARVEASGTRTLGNLEIGDRVVDPSWEWEHRMGWNYSFTGETKPVIWIVVAKDHYGAGSGVTLLAEELIGLHAFDNSKDRGSNVGSNHWGNSGTTDATSGLRPWLNSSGIHSGEGFYRAFSAGFQAAVVQVTIPNKEWQAGDAYTTQDRVFIPSTTELGDTEHDRTYQIGTVYPFFFGTGKTDRVAQLGGGNRWYWTRSPDTLRSYLVRYVSSAGAFFNDYHATHSDFDGVRPALNLKSDTLVTEIKNADGAYELLEPLSATVTTTEASDINTNSVTLNLTYTAGDFTPEVRFVYREDGDEDWTETEWVADPGSPYTLTITGLDPGTTYDFRGQLKYNDTVIDGDLFSFSTLPDPVPVQHTTIYWQNTETGLRFLWFMDGLDVIDMDGIGMFGAGVWNIVGVGDLDGDGRTDIVWHNTESGLLYAWMMDGLTQLAEGGIGIVENLDWRATAVGDMNGNGSSDIIWENTANGRRLVWFMDGLDVVDQVFLEEQPDPAWSIVAAADMNGNGQTDLILQNADEGLREVWLMNGLVKEQKVPFAHDKGLGPQWQIAAAGDLNRNGYNDIVWEDHDTGLRFVWFMEGLEEVGGGGLGIIDDASWDLVALAEPEVEDDTVEAPLLVQVGSPGVTYTIPTGTDDSGTEQVAGGYEIAATPVTYELWYAVREWAEANGYHFQNMGREGDQGTDGAAPTAARFEPVTRVIWRDCVVWLNALSEKEGLSPVYRTADNVVIKDSRNDNAAAVDGAVQTANNGYRLPTSMEWEMAARWKNDTESTDGSIERGGRWWTPGNYASGATGPYTDADATGAVAWYWDNSDTGQGRKTQPVGLKNANHLGLYDMSGNVWEWCFDQIGSYRVIRGGSWYGDADYLRVGSVGSRRPWLVSSYVGFRFSRTP